jgi:tetratricopeptide (TPR) repeat protein
LADDNQALAGERIPSEAYTWRELSELVQQARAASVPTTSNEALEHQLSSDPDGPLAPPLLLWTGDNFMMEKGFAEATEVYWRLIDRFPDRAFGEGTWASLALERVAECQARLGRPEAAIGTLERMIDSRAEGRSSAYLHHRAGQIAEDAGRPEDALGWYERAASASDNPRETQVSIPDLARRDVERLRSDRAWMRREPETLAKELARALEAGGQGLSELASPTHFGLGVLNGERVFVDHRAVLEILVDDLGRSNVRTDPYSLWGTGDKRYLEAEGWQGSFFTGRVVFLLSRAPEGWEWSGVALTAFPEADWERLLGPPRGESNQPLSLIIKSPWPAGVNFRAGGIVPFGLQVAACLGLGPFAFVCFAIQAASPCGFGPGGLYYGGVLGFNFTHGGDDFFAIDFARFRPGLPLANATFGTPVRCVQTGMVSGVRATIGTGSTTTDNRVLVKHMTEGEFILIVILEILSGQPLRPLANPPFTSMYLHLDGPFRVPISPGMFARQGAALGPMDDTGLSVDHHLHFSVHDRSLPAASAPGVLNPAGRSVRPTPMDGQRLIEADDGRCVSSTNV